MYRTWHEWYGILRFHCLPHFFQLHNVASNSPAINTVYALMDVIVFSPFRKAIHPFKLINHRRLSVVQAAIYNNWVRTLIYRGWASPNSVHNFSEHIKTVETMSFLFRRSPINVMANMMRFVNKGKKTTKCGQNIHQSKRAMAGKHKIVKTIYYSPSSEFTLMSIHQVSSTERTFNLVTLFHIRKRNHWRNGILMLLIKECGAKH